MFALLIAARSQRALGHLDESREMSAGVLALAEKVNDEGRIALAASDMAGVNTVLGRYPEALELRQRAEGVYRRQGDQTSLPYTLANRADLLIRLGRPSEADAALSELEAGIARGLQAYTGRARRAASLRAFQAAAALRCQDALRFAAAASRIPNLRIPRRSWPRASRPTARPGSANLLSPLRLRSQAPTRRRSPIGGTGFRLRRCWTETRGAPCSARRTASRNFRHSERRDPVAAGGRRAGGGENGGRRRTGGADATGLERRLRDDPGWLERRFRDVRVTAGSGGSEEADGDGSLTAEGI